MLPGSDQLGLYVLYRIRVSQLTCSRRCRQPWHDLAEVKTLPALCKPRSSTGQVGGQRSDTLKNSPVSPQDDLLHQTIRRKNLYWITSLDHWKPGIADASVPSCLERTTNHIQALNLKELSKFSGTGWTLLWSHWTSKQQGVFSNGSKLSSVLADIITSSKWMTVPTVTNTPEVCRNLHWGLEKQAIYTGVRRKAPTITF